MSLFLFITTCVSILVLFFGYVSDEFTEINLAVRLGWGGICFLFLMFFFCFVRLLFGIAKKQLGKIMKRRPRAAAGKAGGSDSFDPRRRVFIKRSLDLGVIVASGALTVQGALAGARAPDVITVRAPIRGLPESLRDFRVVQISDIHANIAIKREWVQAVVDRVNSLSPDLIALTGDMVDDTVENLRDIVAPFSQLSAEYGCYYVTGNHEYFVRNVGDVNTWLEEVERLGFTALLNDHRLLRKGESRLLVAGVTDYTAHYRHPAHASDPGAAIQGAPDSDVKILLAHQPKSIYKAAESGFDLQLSGHTHGGQFFPGQLIMGLAQPYVSGLHTHESTLIYVNRATGYGGPPLRLGAPSEITLLKLGEEEVSG